MMTFEPDFEVRGPTDFMKEQLSTSSVPRRAILRTPDTRAIFEGAAIFDSFGMYDNVRITFTRVPTRGPKSAVPMISWNASQSRTQLERAVYSELSEPKTQGPSLRLMKISELPFTPMPCATATVPGALEMKVPICVSLHEHQTTQGNSAWSSPMMSLARAKNYLRVTFSSMSGYGFSTCRGFSRQRLRRRMAAPRSRSAARGPTSKASPAASATGPPHKLTQALKNEIRSVEVASVVKRRIHQLTWTFLQLEAAPDRLQRRRVL